MGVVAHARDPMFLRQATGDAERAPAATSRPAGVPKGRAPIPRRALAQDLDERMLHGSSARNCGKRRRAVHEFTHGCRIGPRRRKRALNGLRTSLFGAVPMARALSGLTPRSTRWRFRRSMGHFSRIAASSSFDRYCLAHRRRSAHHAKGHALEQ